MKTTGNLQLALKYRVGVQVRDAAGQCVFHGTIRKLLKNAIDLFGIDGQTMQDGIEKRFLFSNTHELTTDIGR